MRQRPVAIIIFAILNLGFGLLSLMSPLSMFAMKKVVSADKSGAMAIFSDPAYMSWTSVKLTVAVVLGVALVTFGIGLLMSKNWARVGSIIYSVLVCPWVVISCYIEYPYLRQIYEQMPRMPRDFADTLAVLVVGAMLVFGLAYPGLLIFFMTRDKVIEACQPEPQQQQQAPPLPS